MRTLLGVFTLLLMSALSPATAQVRGTYEIVAWQNVRIACQNMNGLVSRLHLVTNEMQVYNNDERTWHNQGTCSLNVFREVAFRDFLGWYDTGKFLVGIEIARYKDEPDAPRDPNKKPCRFLCVKITNTKDFTALRPIYIVRSAHARMPPECFRASSTINGVTLYGNYGQGVLPNCIPNAGYDNLGHATN